MKLSSRRVNVRLESSFMQVVRSITTVLHEEKDPEMWAIDSSDRYHRANIALDKQSSDSARKTWVMNRKTRLETQKKKKKKKKKVFFCEFRGHVNIAAYKLV